MYWYSHALLKPETTKVYYREAGFREYAPDVYRASRQFLSNRLYPSKASGLLDGSLLLALSRRIAGVDINDLHAYSSVRSCEEPAK